MVECYAEPICTSLVFGWSLDMNQCKNNTSKGDIFKMTSVVGCLHSEAKKKTASNIVCDQCVTVSQEETPDTYASSFVLNDHVSAH